MNIFERKPLLSLYFAAIVTVTSCGVAAAQAKSGVQKAVFWNELQKLCGKAYSGTVAAAPADDTTFKD